MNFEKKLYEYEVNPPEKVWDQLSIALNDLQLESSFKKKLDALKTTPPINAWKKISKNLEVQIDNTVPDQLYNLAETPPADTWSRIDEQLIEDDFNLKFSGHLSNIEVKPPSNGWERIAANLYEETPIVPIRKKYTRVYRYAAAAIVISIIAWSGIRYFTNSRISSSATAVVKKENIIPDTPIIPQTQNTIPNIANSDQQEKDVNEKIVLNKKEKRNNYLRSNNPSNTNYIAASNLQETHLESEEIIADVNAVQKNKALAVNSSTDTTAPRYLVYLNDEGSLMKISKKLADLKCIYTKDGDVSQNALAKLDRTLCNDIVLCWQEKLALSPTNLSFNPLEMADILK